MNANSDKDYIDAKVEGMHAIMEGQFAAVHARFDVVDTKFEMIRSEMDMLRAEVTAKVEQGVSQMVKWVVGLFVATIALCIALASVVMHLSLEKPQTVLATPALSAPAVIIQLTPAGATVIPAAPAGKP